MASSTRLPTQCATWPSTSMSSHPILAFISSTTPVRSIASSVDKPLRSISNSPVDGAPHRFDLQFVRAGTNVVLGSIPVVFGTPIPGDCYEYDELEDGEIEVEDDFGSQRSLAVLPNQPPSFVAGAISVSPKMLVRNHLLTGRLPSVQGQRAKAVRSSTSSSKRLIQRCSRPLLQ